MQDIRGKLVLVRTVDDRPELRLVWDATEKLIYICSERQFKTMKAGGVAPPPIGFPSNDVFCYDEKAQDFLQENSSIDWSKLNLFSATHI